MALKQVLLTRKLAGITKALNEAREKDAGFATRQAALETREAELEAALLEVTDETSADDKKGIEDEIDQHEENKKALASEQAANDADKQQLSDQIAGLQKELDELNARAKAPAVTPEKTARKDEHHMNTRVKFFGMNKEERSAFFARDEVKGFLENVRSIKTRAVSNGSLTIPDIMMGILRDNLEQFSKLAKYVTQKTISGTARQNIVGAAPEGVWMEATGALNELDMSLNQIEVDGYMVGGIIWVHNTLLEDTDMNLGAEIMDQLGKAIGKGVDKAILFGTGTKTPVGILTRLAQTSAPSTWGTYAPTWTDLHTSNVIKLNIDATTGAAFYASLITSLGVAKPNYSDGRVFWAMNRKTHIKLMTKALAFNAAAALVAGINSQMPIVGGDIVEIELLGDNEIVGGFGSLYLLAERAGAKVESSEHARFQEMLTGFRGYARYDGMPVFGEGFVAVSFDNTDTAVTATFPDDYANTELGVLGVVTADGTSSGDSIATVTGTESSGTTLKYKLGDLTVVRGQTVVGYTTLVSGTTQITAVAGKTITVVELDANSKVIKVGKALTHPKA